MSRLVREGKCPRYKPDIGYVCNSLCPLCRGTLTVTTPLTDAEVRELMMKVVKALHMDATHDVILGAIAYTLNYVKVTE
jgi:hypothetical protein